MKDQFNYYNGYRGLDISSSVSQHSAISSYYGVRSGESFVVPDSSYRGDNQCRDVKPIVIKPRDSNHCTTQTTGQCHMFNFSSEEMSVELTGNSWVESETESVAGRGRSERKPISEELKDERYYERRHRNNDAAKRSRDARKKRMEAIIRRTNILERENLLLRAQRSTLYDQLCTMRQIAIKRDKQPDYNPFQSLSNIGLKTH